MNFYDAIYAEYSIRSHLPPQMPPDFVPCDACIYRMKPIGASPCNKCIRFDMIEIGDETK